jgi:hypothetical protein
MTTDLLEGVFGFDMVRYPNFGNWGTEGQCGDLGAASDLEDAEPRGAGSIAAALWPAGLGFAYCSSLST